MGGRVLGVLGRIVEGLRRQIREGAVLEEVRAGCQVGVGRGRGAGDALPTCTSER